jgi:spermidine synthase
MRPARPSGFFLASLLFVVSGATALAYELIWFKRFAHLWGSSSYAMASVVAAFLFGLGAGAAIAGPIADRLRRPLAAYAACEAAIGVLALLVPLELAWLFERTAALHAALPGGPLIQAVARFALTLAVLGPPCALMGATLPLLVRQFAAGGMALGASTAWLYAFNTLGAAAGAWIAGFHLLPSLGLSGSNWAAALASFAVAAAAAALARRSPPLGAPVEPETVHLAQPGPRRGAIAGAAALTGFGSLALQMLWARQLAVLVGPTTYAFTAAIFVFILGLGLGSLVFRFALSGRSSLRGAVSLAVALVIVPALAGLELRPSLAMVAGSVRELRTAQLFNALFCAGVGAVLMGLSTLGMGMLFPALVELGRHAPARAGRAVGSVYAWSSAGSIAAAATTSVWILPALESFGAFRLALLLYLAALCLLFPPSLRERGAASLGAAAVCVLAIALTWRRPDPLATQLGFYLYGIEYANQQLHETPRPMEPAFFCEGPTSDILVVQAREGADVPVEGPARRLKRLHVDGKVDASNSSDMETQLALAYFPRFLRPRAREVLVIGMGSGTTAGASLLFAETRVTCCEIEPCVVEAARAFAPENHRPFDSPRFEVLVEDGRAHLQGTRRRYDLILSEPSNPWMAGVSNLFTLEFYRAARERLNPGGMLVQWLQTYAISPRQYALVVRTILAAFPRCALVRISGGDTLVVASLAPVLPQAETVLEAQALTDGSPAIQADLRAWYRSTDVRVLLLERLLLDERGLQRLIAAQGGEELHTDLDLRLEFEAPRELFAEPSRIRGETSRSLLAAVDVALQRDLFQRWGCGPEHVRALRTLRELFLGAGLVRHAAAAIELGLAYAPDEPDLIAESLLLAPIADLERFALDAQHLLELSPSQAYRLGKTLAQRGQAEAARRVLEPLVDRFPQSSTAWAALGIVYASLGREAEARQALEKARALDPLDDLARSAGAVMEAEQAQAGK